MSSRCGSSSSNGGGVQSMPAAARKMVQSLKEIVHCPDAEIYAMLKDCNMDPNEAVSRLLSQGSHTLSLSPHTQIYKSLFVFMFS